MAKKNTPKRIFAGAMALLSVAASVPATAISPLMANYSIVANAETVTIPTNDYVAERSFGEKADIESDNVVNAKEVSDGDNSGGVDFVDSSALSGTDKYRVYKPATSFTGDVKVKDNVIGSAGNTIIINDLNITSDQDLRIKGTVIINGGSITMKNGANITVDGTTNNGVLYLNNTTVTRTSETGNEATAALILNNKGTVYINGSTVDDQATYKYTDLNADIAAIKNSRASTNDGGKLVISDGKDVQKLIGLEKDTSSEDGKYKLKFEELAKKNSEIKSTGAAILNGALSELWVLGADISGTSTILKGETFKTRSQGSVVPVVETSGNANFVSGSVTDSAGNYAVVAIEKWQKAEEKNGTVTVNFGDGVEGSGNKFTVTGGVSVADTDRAGSDDGTIAVNVNGGADVDDVTMGLPGSPCATDVGYTSGSGMSKSHFYGGTLNVEGGTVGSIKMNDQYYSKENKGLSNTSDEVKNALKPGQVNVKSGTVGSVDIPVNERTRDAVNITGGTVTSAAPEFYQHTYVVEKTETTGDDAVVTFTLSCSEEATCGLKPVVVTVKKETKVSQVKSGDSDAKDPKAFIPSITVTGGDKAEATTVQWLKNSGDNNNGYPKTFDAAALNEAIKAAVREHGLDILTEKDVETPPEGNYMKVETAIKGGSSSSGTKNELGYPTDYETANWEEPEITISFDTQNVDGGTTTKKSENTKVKITTVAPSVLGFKVETETNVNKFFGLNSGNNKFGLDATKTNYDITYSTTAIKGEYDLSSKKQATDFSGFGVDYYKDAACEKKADVSGDTDKKLVLGGEDSDKSLIKSIKAEFSSDDGKTWKAEAKECGTYKVRYTLVFTDSEKTSLKWDADYTITINKAEFTAQAYAGNAKFNGVGESNKSTYVANFDNSNTHKVIKDTADGTSITDADLEIFNKWLVSGDALTETGKEVFGENVPYKSANLVVGTIGQTLGGKGGIFSDVDVFNGETRQAGIDAEVYAKKVGTEEEFSASDPLTAGVFAVYAKLSEESSNYTMKDDVLGYVVVDGIDVKTASVTLPEYTFKYDGKKKQVDLDSMKVVVGGKQLEYGVDFQISGTYMAVKENTYVFTIEGDGDYCGTKEVVWKIAKDEDVAKSEGLKTSVRIDPNSTGKIDISAVREVPAGYEVVDAGLLISNDEKTTLKEFKAGKSNKSGVAINKSVAKYKGTGLAIYTFTLTTKSKSYAVVSYMTVKNADGKKVTIYSNDVTQIKEQDLIDYNNHLDRSLFPIFTVENKDGNVNAFQFTAIRNVSEAFADAGYTVKEAGILMENETLAERAGREFKIDSKADKKDGTLSKKLCADGDNTRKKDTANYTVGTATVKSTSLDSLVSSLKQSVTLNNPDMATNARAYLVISKGNKEYYYYSDQVNIGAYSKADASTASSTTGKRPITTIEAEGPTGNDVPKLTN